MAFSLRTTRDNQLRVFSVKKILELLGEDVNNEINIEGKAYLLSSFVELNSNSSGQNTLWQTIELVISQNNQQILPLNIFINDADSPELFINGILYSYGITRSFHITDNNLFWHGGFGLEISDVIYLKYLVQDN